MGDTGAIGGTGDIMMLDKPPWKPFLDRLPSVSDERDIDEPDADEEIVFKDPIVGGSASLLGQR
jgi:hypothetical protein